MEPVSRLVSLASMLLVVWSGAGWSLPDVGDEHQECTSQNDTLLQGTCELGGHFSQGYRCSVTPGVKCQGKVYVGEGSVCVRDGSNDFFKCSKGQWLGYYEIDDGDLGKERVKRGFRFRRAFRRVGRFFRRVGRAVDKVFCWVITFGRCSSSSSSPPPPNRPPYFTSCPTMPPQTADSGALTKTVSWPLPTAADPDGETPSVTRVGGQPSGSVFNEGTTSVLYRARDARGGVDFCPITVQVTVITCWSGYKMLQYGDQVCTGPRYNIYGSVCSHSCVTGYELVGSRSVTCQNSGQWSSSFPTCQPVSCGTPGGVVGGQLLCPIGHSYLSICIIQCQAGYSHTGATFVWCQASKAWTSADACKDTEAPQFPGGCPPNQQLYSGPLQAPVNVTWADPQVKDNSNQPVTLTSNPAKDSALGVGFHVIRISAADVAGNTAACSFVVTVQERRCPSIMAPGNSHVTCTSGYVEGSECTVTCNEGYRLQGDATAQCVSPGQWNSSLPACMTIICPAPSAVSHGSFQCGGSLEFRSVCTLTCDPGFSVQGSQMIQCQANGTWSLPGACKDVEPPEFVNSPCHDNIEVYAPRLGELAFVHFTDPDVTDNSGSHVTLTSDVTSGSAFPVGPTPVTFTATDSDGNSRTCQFTVTVTSLTCGTPDLELANRTRTFMTYACPDGHVHGATCTLGCQHGLLFMGASNITCERDDSTYPPTMEWVWPDPHLGKPECKENNCTNLTAPVNGALQCYLGSFGWDCLMSCSEDWDIPAYTDGHFYCTNSDRIWRPPVVPDCLVRVRPGRVRMQSDVFYYAGSCETSLDALKQSFISRISNSTWKDACVGVPSCVWQNVQVWCGPTTNGRKKRGADLWSSLYHRFTHAVRHLLRQKRQTHYVLIDFEIVIEYDEGNLTRQEAYQTYMSTISAIYSQLQADANAGHFDLLGLTTDGYNVGYPRTVVDCPPGTLFRATASTTSFSCAGCSKGYYLPLNGTQCQECPRGEYTEEDNATSCTPCPPGWSTPSTGAQHSSECKELCPAGTFSQEGFVSCQACPPGHYQSQEGSTQCHRCPAGTWTASANATGLDDCRDSDVRLSANQSLSAEVTGQWGGSSLSAQLWLHMGVSSRCEVTLRLGSSPSSVSLSLVLETNGTGAASSPAAGSAVPALKMEPNTWRNLLFTLEPQNPAGDVQVYHHGVVVHSASLGLVVNQVAALQVTAFTNSSSVVVSGLRADGKSLSQEEITAALRKCTGEKSSNVMTWVPAPGSVYLPSACDAVDECLSSPCGSHGQCQNLQGGYLCVCAHGWTGSDCEVPPGVCDHDQCQNGATCLPATAAAAGSSNFSCLCDADHSGTWCELEKVHGGYGSWSAWSTCSATCGGTQQRHRQCDNPASQNGGRNCTGSDMETTSCGASSCPRDGGYSEWSPFGPCSATCGGGERTRHRKCDNPTPQNNGAPCVGESVEREACNMHLCPVEGGWGNWVTWGHCSVTCGDGHQSRERSCDSPVPSNGGRNCSEMSKETKRCKLGKCSNCTELARPYGTLRTCVEEASPYLKTCNFTCRPGFVAAFSFPTYTCGEETGYLWNHERDHYSHNPQLPSCSRPKTLSSVVIQQAALLGTTCDAGVGEAVLERVEDNLATTLPCRLQNRCTVSLTSDCYDLADDSKRRRRRRATDPLVVLAEVTVDLGTSQVLEMDDTAAMAAYQQLLTLAQDTYVMMTENATAALYTVTVNGYVITPTNVTHDAHTSCPSGYISLGELCGECPVGSKEKEGECVLCPKGEYQDQAASTSCKPCPDGHSWDVPGATDIAQCIVAYVSPPDNEGSGDFAVIVGSVCGAVAFMALLLGLLLYRLKRPQYKGKPLLLRPPSALSRSKVWPDRDGQTSDVVSAPSRASTPSALQLKVLGDKVEGSPPRPKAWPPLRTGLGSQWASPLPPPDKPEVLQSPAKH